MKYYKFKKIVKGENPIIRITYKTWWGKFVEKDVIKNENVEGYWNFMEDNGLTHNFGPINNFHENDKDIYFVNGE
jgi:hypothetical protein